MMSRPLRLGFIGGGVNSAVGSTHFIASQMDGRFKIVSGCFSRNTDVNVETSEKWNINPKHLYDDIDDFLVKEKGEVDAVVVLTPTPDHVKHVVQLLQSGFPVICEKALANTSAGALAIRNAQIERGGFLTVTYNYTGYPMIRELRSMISKNKLGNIKQVHIEMPQEGFARLDQGKKLIVPQSWRLHDSSALPVISLDLGVHVHHIIAFLTHEKPIELVAMQNSLGNFQQVVDNVICMARYTNNLSCNIWFSKSALGHRNGLRVRVFGDKGAAEWFQMDPEQLIYYDNIGHKSIIDRADVDVSIANQSRYNRFKSGHPAGFLEAFANVYWDIADNLYDFIKSGRQSTDALFSTQHAIDGLLMLEAMTKSSANNSWQSLSGFDSL